VAKPPPTVAKKRGFGCCGCGCLFLAVLALLLCALIGGTGYLAYHEIVQVTSTTPVTIPTFDGGDQVYSSAQQKMQAFDHDVQNHVPATLRLSADEINTLIARNPNFSKNNIQLYVSMHDDQARLQSSIPSGLFSGNTIKGRYLNADVSFSLSFDNESKMISFNLKSAKVGSTTLPENNLAGIQASTDPAINGILQKTAGFKEIIQQASSIEIKDSELVIQTK